MEISEIYVYPIKSLGGYAVQQAQIVRTGLQYDRRWMLVDEQNVFLTQRQYPEMALLKVEEVERGFLVTHKKDITRAVLVPFIPESSATMMVTIWDDTCEAVEVSNACNQWFSEILGMSARLVYMPDTTERKVNKQYACNEEITAFSDGYPMLMIGQSSMDLLNQKLLEPLGIDRFRPNIVFTGAHAHLEDEMASFTINGINFLGVKPSSRCVVTTINQQTAERGKEPLQTLAGYRQKNNKIYFGQNVLPQESGIIKLRDIIEVNKYSQPFI